MPISHPKTAFVFPGTCVKVPMGESLIESCAEVAGLFKTAEEILGRPLGRIMREGPLEELQRPLNALPATFLSSISVFNVLISKGVRPSVLLGRSLGDLTSVVASGAVTFETGLRLVKLRGELFEKACAGAPGNMAVILGLMPAETAALCKLSEQQTGGICEVASINTESNCVISGHVRTVQKVIEMAQIKNASVIPLPLTRPYHSSLMKEAESEFLTALAGLHFHEPLHPVVSEPAGRVVSKGSEILELMTLTPGRCVNWVKRVGLVKNMGIGRFLELGPNQGMAAIASRLLEGTTGRNIETCEDIKSLLMDNDDA